MISGHLIGRDALLIMVSNSKKQSIDSFQKKYELGKLPRVVILSDSTGSFGRLFKSEFVPVTFVYYQGVLIKRFVGELPMDILSAKN
jgi:hypothetical protein